MPSSGWQTCPLPDRLVLGAGVVPADRNDVFELVWVIRAVVVGGAEIERAKRSVGSGHGECRAVGGHGLAGDLADADIPRLGDADRYTRAPIGSPRMVRVYQSPPPAETNP